MPLPSAAHEGTSPGEKLTSVQSTKNSPMPTSRHSGVSFSPASTVIARAPSSTPKAFSAYSSRYRPVSRAARGTGWANHGTRLAICTANAAATPALEATLLIHISAPARKPAKLPKVARR